MSPPAGRCDTQPPLQKYSAKRFTGCQDRWLSQDKDEDKEDKEEEEENAWDAMDRETEALIMRELRKDEESLYDDAAASAPIPRPTTPSEAEILLPTYNNNDSNDDPEAQFWAMHRAQQAETERKALEKEANFIREWCSAFVHLRVVGQTIPPPPFYPPPPPSKFEDKVEILASHGNGGQADNLGHGGHPNRQARKPLGGNNSCSTSTETKVDEETISVQREELLARLLEGVWQDWLTLLEKPLAQMMTQKDFNEHIRCDQERQISRGEGKMCVEGHCSSGAATTSPKRKLNT